jgi:hypothetical protein
MVFLSPSRQTLRQYLIQVTIPLLSKSFPVHHQNLIKRYIVYILTTADGGPTIITTIEA